MSFDNSGSGSASLAPYWFSAFPFPPGHFTVHKVAGTESISGPYRWSVTVTANTLLGDMVERLAVNRAASLVIRTGPKPRVITGVVESVDFEGLRQSGKAVQTTFHIVPSVALLKQECGSRIFQKMSVPDVIREVLREWGIPSTWKLTRRYPAKEYITQAQETTFDFVHRLIGEAGIFYGFAHHASALGNFLGAVEGLIATAVADFASLAAAAASGISHPGETLVFGDDASTYPSIIMSDAEEILDEVSDVVSEVGGLSAEIAVSATGVSADLSLGALAMHLGPAPSLSYETAEGTGATRANRVFKFVSTRSVCSDVAEYREFDPARPESPLMSRTGDLRALLTSPASAISDLASGATAQITASLSDPLSAVGSLASSGLEMLLGLVSQRQYETYEHEGHFHFADVREVEGTAALMRRRTTRDRVTAEGTSGCPALFAGARFRLEDHPLADENIEHVVIALEHFGEVGSDGVVYGNKFRSVPARITYVPLPPERPPIQVMLPAIVVGAAGEEIDVDAEGRIEVWFPWDRRGRAARRSCRIRPMQFWAHAAYGAQFIPRVGAEVWVTFINGDPDMPAVIGSAWNATHPPNYLLPANKTQSGIKTQTVPGGNGFNEMRFEDARGKEHIYFHAQRDLVEEVNHDHQVLIKNDERVHVQANRRDEVDKNASYEVHGNREDIVHGSRVDVVEKSLDARVTGVRTTRLENQDHLAVRGRAEHRYEDDVATRVIGNETHIVGKHDAKRSWTTRVEGVGTLSAEDGLVLESAKGLTLKCGKTVLRIGEDGIEMVGGMVRMAGKNGSFEAGEDGLTGKSENVLMKLGQKLLVQTDASSLAMGTEFKVDSTKLLFNSPDQATEKPPPQPKPPTKIELKSDDGKPLPSQRFVVELDDGSQRTGATDKDGKASLDLPSGGKIRFPGLVAPKGGGTSGKWSPHVVQQGDHVEKLAFLHGTTADEVWDYSGNASLKKNRRSMAQLLPGDVIQLPELPTKGLTIRSGGTNSYVAKVPTVTVKMSFRDTKGPYANALYHIEGLPLGEGEQKPSGKTGPQGDVTVTVPVTTREIKVVLLEHHLEHHILLGDLDPHNEPSGVVQRLQNLGFLSRDAVPADLAPVVRAFQKSVGLPPTGLIDEPTCERLDAAAAAQTTQS